MSRTEGVELPEGSIVDVQVSYKYRGILQANGNHEEAALPVIRYPTGIINWLKEDIEATETIKIQEYIRNKNRHLVQDQ